MYGNGSPAGTTGDMATTQCECHTVSAASAAAAAAQLRHSHKVTTVVASCARAVQCTDGDFQTGRAIAAAAASSRCIRLSRSAHLQSPRRHLASGGPNTSW